MSDPIIEARRQWIAHGWTDAADGMALVTSVVRVHQLLMERIDAVLRPLDVTFARYEVLRLLAFTREGALWALLDNEVGPDTLTIGRYDGAGWRYHDFATPGGSWTSVRARPRRCCMPRESVGT